MHRDLLGELGRGDEEGERVVVRLRQEGDAPGPTERAKSFEDIRGDQTGLLDERPRDGEAEPELGVGPDKPQEPVERRPVASLGDPLEDPEVPVEVEVRAAGPEIEVAEPGEPPGLMEVEIQDDPQIGIPSARIASR